MRRFSSYIAAAVVVTVTVAACGGSSPSRAKAGSKPQAKSVVANCIAEWNTGIAGTGSIPLTNGVLQTLEAIGVPSSPTAYVTVAPPQQGVLGAITPQGTCMIFWAEEGSTNSAVIAPYSQTGAPGGPLAWTAITPQIPGSFVSDALSDATQKPNAEFDSANGYMLTAYSGSATTGSSVPSSASATPVSGRGECEAVGPPASGSVILGTPTWHEEIYDLLPFPPGGTCPYPSRIMLFKYTYVDTPHWTAWGSATTTATGPVKNNNCTPGCADGTYTTTGTATVTATSPVAGECAAGPGGLYDGYGGSGAVPGPVQVEFYTKLTVQYSKNISQPGGISIPQRAEFTLLPSCSLAPSPSG